MRDDLDLARRAVACKHWRWDKAIGCPILHSGLLNGKPIARLCDIVIGGYSKQDGFSDRDLIQTIHHLHTLIEPVDVLPDFGSAAARGCLLEMVREAWNIPDLSAQRFSGSLRGNWTVSGVSTPWASTEAEALVAALEAAP